MLPYLAPPTNVLDLTQSHPELRSLGLKLLRDGRVAVLTFAGGLSTRMGRPVLRGNLVIGPVTGRTLFELHGEHIAAIRARLAPGLHWLLMTSEQVHERTIASFRRSAWFGLAAETIWFASQRSLPVLGSDLQPARRRDGMPIRSPTGHGAMLEVLSAGFFERLEQLGISYLFSFQYPNVLERICDPVLLGLHCAGGYDATVKGFREVLPGESLGRLAECDGRVHIVEYHYLEDLGNTDRIMQLPANSGTYIWSIDFLRRCVDDGIKLPYHTVPHHEPGDDRPMRKAEQFVFDLLPLARSVGVAIGARASEYQAVKQPNGPDSIEAARMALSALYRTWLDYAGAAPIGAIKQVEINARYAVSKEELAKRLPSGFSYMDGLVLDT